VKVGVVIVRIGGVDGVALEAEKWISVLEDMGHSAAVLTGQLEGDVPGVTVAPELSIFDPECLWEQEVAFFSGERDEEELARRIEALASCIEERISGWLHSEGVDALLAQNCLTIPFHLSLAVALTRIVERTGVRAVSHNHDFYWERGDRFATSSPCVDSILESCFPPRLPSLRHAVINTYCHDQLAGRHGVEAVVVPNVMDFDEPFGARNGYNADLRSELGLPEDAVALFQITRIVERKNIEAAIELLRRLHDPHVHLVITGTAVDDVNGDYLERLQEQARAAGLGEAVHFAGERFARSRGRDAEGRKLYCLGDAYAHADAMTYFSTYEGFGNAFVEAVLARVPVFVNNYQPVYWPDIGSKGFQTVQTEGGLITDETVAEVRALLADPGRMREMAEHNFELGRRCFSYEVLRRCLEELFEG
jgi:mannosylglucosylglycerate synthase